MSGGGPAPRDELELDELLSRPDSAVIESLARYEGDIVVLGAAGKVGPSMCAMLRRALDALGRRDTIYAVSRFSEQTALRALQAAGAEIVRADLTNAHDVMTLPDASIAFHLAGQKFGTSQHPGATWVANTVAPFLAALRYAESRIVAFSTGNVYGFVPHDTAGSRESDPAAPTGEYAMSCLGRERVLEYVSRTRGTPIAILRLNYAVDLRYGVLTDISMRVREGAPVDLRMGYVNVIWQRDAVAWAIRCTSLAASPPIVVNVTGPEKLRVRDIALSAAEILERAPVLQGAEERDALLSDTTLARSRFGPPTVDAETLVHWSAEWVRNGRRTLGLPTHFETRDGRF